MCRLSGETGIIPDETHNLVDLSGKNGTFPDENGKIGFSCGALATIEGRAKLSLRDFVAALRHPFTPAAGRCKWAIKNGVQVNLTPFFTAYLRRERDLNETSNRLQNILCFNILFHTQVFEIT